MVYVKQYNNGRHSCGPIAILNALRFQKRHYLRRHLPQLARRLRVTKGGTSINDIERCLKEMKIGWRMRKPSPRKICQALINGNGIIICATFNCNGKPGGHVMFIPGIRFHGLETLWFVTNAPGGEHRWIDPSDLENYYHTTTDEFRFYPIYVIPPRKRK